MPFLQLMLRSLLIPLAIGALLTQAARAETLVFQAAGPTAESIQSTVEAYRAALGAPNGSNEGPLAEGRREINWDGIGASDVTTPPATPFDGFLDTRGARFTTRGTGLSQAPPAGGPEGGLARLFDNPSYGTIFAAFSPLRLFTPVGSHLTDAFFFIPGSNGEDPATVAGFGAVFTDVDRPDGSSRKFGGRGSTQLQYFDADGKVLFSGFVPSSPGDASQSFFGVVFDEAVIGSVRITSGNAEPGPDDGAKLDVVMMDDFIYGEPQPLPEAARGRGTPRSRPRRAIEDGPLGARLAPWPQERSSASFRAGVGWLACTSRRRSGTSRRTWREISRWRRWRGAAVSRRTTSIVGSGRASGSRRGATCGGSGSSGRPRCSSSRGAA